jgi:lipopolysaccharide export system protein LptA
MTALGLMALMAGFPAATMGVEPPLPKAIVQENEDIYISADEVITELESGKTLFEGNVRVSQGQSVITADRMIVYYRKAEGDPDKLAVGESIQKIIARGNVEINYENLIAFTDKAVYMADAKVLTLSGTNTKVISGKSSITGSKFILSLTDGGLSIRGRNGQRVRALVFPGKGDLF